MVTLVLYFYFVQIISSPKRPKIIKIIFEYFRKKMVDWSEIEALQNELEEVQKESTATRLSERNCVELIMKLKELNLIKVYFHISTK